MLTIHNDRAEAELVFTPAFVPVLLLGPPTMVGPVGKPGKGLVFAPAFVPALLLGPPTILGPVGRPGKGGGVAHAVL